jgi:hypothetical protein
VTPAHASAAREHLRQEIRQKARAAQARPAQLPVPDLGGAAAAKRLRQWPVDEPHLQARVTHDLGCRRVLGNFLAERFDAAGALKVGTPPQHGFALGKATAEAVDDVLPARLIGVEESAFDFRPKSSRPGADGRGGDETGVGAPACKQPLNVVMRHQHVAVGDNDPVVGGGVPALDHIVELGICAHAVVADEKPCAGIGILRHQVLDQRQDRIRRGRNTKQDLVARVVEIECRAQCIGSIIVDPAKRAHHTDRRILPARRFTARMTVQAENRDHDARDLNDGDGNTKRRGGENRRCHRANV